MALQWWPEAAEQGPPAQGPPWEGQQQLAAALAACSSLEGAPAAGEAALQAANAAANTLLQLAEGSKEQEAVLQCVVR